ncbi:uncharacterized protein CLIB1423_38S00276 [[Candida] railenensis]|uniref:Nudix hydrolase domain-containing protein n=1 Tax=[Candida] railenensis TaxID=45579 RepID=A0A9P0QWN5_9ASCO|nr:uncharacterized protein CLIB1423_38S00276 [[Candida] railenensis]
MSFLSIIEKVDTFPYFSASSDYYTLVTHDALTPIGYITSEIAIFLSLETKYFNVDSQHKLIKISPDLDTFEKRNEAFAFVGEKWKVDPHFEIALGKGWRNELYAVYGPDHTPYLLIERAVSVLLGVNTYGVHINGYIEPQNTSNGKLKVWVPRRSATKPTYPGKLDNTVAGGIGYPQGIWETVVKESFEEAGLNEEFVKSHTRANGVVSYMIQPSLNSSVPPEGLVVQPEVEYTFDLEFDNETDVVPQPEDGEAESFHLMDVDEVLERIRNDEFKPNCALIFIDFLIRHGEITAENEPNYTEIVSRCHRRLPFPTK